MVTRTRWCIVHNQPAGPQAYAYCWDIDAENFPNKEFVAEVKEREGCDIRDVFVSLARTGSPV
jgi:hypothetical protein